MMSVGLSAVTASPVIRASRDGPAAAVLVAPEVLVALAGQAAVASASAALVVLEAPAVPDARVAVVGPVGTVALAAPVVASGQTRRPFEFGDFGLATRCRVALEFVDGPRTPLGDPPAGQSN